VEALAGQRVVVTRAAHQAEELAAPLEQLGAQVIRLPLIGIAPPLDADPLRAAAAQLDRYDWLIFTSVNAVAALAAELSDSSPQFRGCVAAVGARTREYAESRGFTVSVTPEEYVAESLIESFDLEGTRGCRVLIPGAAVRRDIVEQELRRRGAHVDSVEAYRNVIPESSFELARAVFQNPLPDWVTFASSSAVDHLIELVAFATLARVKTASIGPKTSETLARHGLPVSAEARVHTAAGLVEALRITSQTKEKPPAADAQ
jgi:uroporphyrinogen-III synthase